MKNTLTFEDFESRCRVEAELLEEGLRSYLKRQQDWDLVFGLTNHPLLTWVKEEGFYYGVVFPVGANGWRVRLLKAGIK